MMARTGIPLFLIRTAVITVCSVATASAASARTPRPAQPGLEAALTPGMTVWITDAGGREEKTRIVGVSGGILTTTARGAIRRLRTSDISRIRVRQSDKVINGALIGAAAAVGSGLFLCRLTEPWEICRDSGPLLRIGAIGAGLGMGIDALIRGRRTIYEAAPQTMRLHILPMIARDAMGVQLSIGF
jgi:hypothetical protein